MENDIRSFSAKMKTFLFIFLAGYAVRCDDSTNYYVVQMPDNDNILPKKEFNVYWNVPTMQCRQRKIYFQDLYDKYGIIQNTGDTFRGDKISILYDPGEFPALLRNSTSGEIKYRNGGVPQEGNLIRHLDTFQRILEQSVPDKYFDGVGIIDFESWRPVFRQNFGILTPYKDVSYEIEKKRHWWWKKQWLQEEAKRRFEEASREFMQATLSLAKKMRPRALWGYYGFPYCFNMANNRKESCADNVPQENDRIGWLWQESTALYPSVYSSDDMTPDQLAGLLRGRVREAARVAARAAPVLPYFWYRYRDKGYFNERDLDVALSTFYKSNASGFIIWGSSNDVNTLEKCQNLKKYVTDTLGPAIARYTKRNMWLEDDPDETDNVVYKPYNASKYDPEYNWIPPVNYTQKVEEMVDKELKEEKEAAVAHKDNNESVLVDLILHKIANYCAEGCDNKSKVRRTDENEGDGGTNESRVVLVTEDPFKKNYIRTAETTVPTTTEEDIYDYDSDTAGDDTAEDIYETNEFIIVSTTSKSIDQISTTIKSIEEISTSTAKADAISTIDISKRESKLNINKEQNSTVAVSSEESSTIAIKTTETHENRLIIEEINAVDLSTEETNSTEEESTTDNSTITTEPSINGTTTTSQNIVETSTIKNDLSIDENITESNSIEVIFIDISTEESSTINPTTVDSTTVGTNSTTVEPSTFDNSTKHNINSTTVEPSTFDNGTKDNINSATVEPSTLHNGTKNSINSTTVEPSTADDGTTDSIISATVKLSTINNRTTVGSKSATVEPSAVDNGTAVGTKSDSSTTLVPVLTEQVLGSVSRAIVSKPVACSLFYIYSITKCICVLFGKC